MITSDKRYGGISGWGMEDIDWEGINLGVVGSVLYLEVGDD